MAGDRRGRCARETREEEDDRWAWFVSVGGGCAGERLSGERRLIAVARLSAGARARAGEWKRAAVAGLSAEGEREGGGPRGKMDWASVGEERSRAEEMRERAGWAAFVFLSLSSSFLFQTPLKIFEFKFKFEFKPHSIK
jgi:hypothetical protein